MEQLTTLDVELGDQDSAIKLFATLKNELAEEKAARVKAQADAETLAREVEDLKKMVDRFAARVPTLEEKLKQLDNKVLDSLTEHRAHELNLEQTTKVSEDYRNQNTRLLKKLERMSSLLISPDSLFEFTNQVLTL
jgi:chromosome segregation ATPase